MTVRLFVQVWCEIDPTLNVRVDRKSGRPLAEDGDVLMRVSRLGRSGVTAALQIDGAEITAFSIGAGHEPALRHALAAGAVRAVELVAQGDEPDVCSAAGSAGTVLSISAVADWLRTEKPLLLIADRIAGHVAGRLGWTHLAGLEDLRIQEGHLRAVRHLEKGDRELVVAELPAAVRLQPGSARPDYVCRARIDQIQKQPIVRTVLSVGDADRRISPDGTLQRTRPRTRLGQAPPPTAAGGLDRLSALMGLTGAASTPVTAGPERVDSTPDELAEEFVRYLAHHDLLPERRSSD